MTLTDPCAEFRGYSNYGTTIFSRFLYFIELRDISSTAPWTLELSILALGTQRSGTHRLSFDHHKFRTQAIP